MDLDEPRKQQLDGVVEAGRSGCRATLRAATASATHKLAAPCRCAGAAFHLPLARVGKRHAFSASISMRSAAIGSSNSRVRATWMLSTSSSCNWCRGARTPRSTLTAGRPSPVPRSARLPRRARRSSRGTARPRRDARAGAAARLFRARMTLSVALVTRDDFAEPSGRRSPVADMDAQLARERSAAIDRVTRTPDAHGLLVTFEPAAPAPASWLEQARAPLIRLRKHDDPTPPCASSSVKTAMRSPLRVFSWRPRRCPRCWYRPRSLWHRRVPTYRRANL